jgi:CheY-like chemotaxis protein
LGQFSSGDETMATVLVVDDSAVDRRLVAGLLKQSNLQVEMAQDGREALDCLRATQIDLVVTDLQMPELDGLGLVRHVRDHGPHVPVILITAHARRARNSRSCWKTTPR